LLEQSARRTPQKTALVCGDARVSYAELEERSNRLANALLARGVAPGERVAVCLDNVAEAVISTFGAWKSGAVLLLVNPATKHEKLAFLLRDSGACALIAPEKRLEGFAPDAGPRLRLAPGPDLDAALAGASAAAPDAHANADELACLLYTSGSTGTPKGVMHSHRSLGSVTRSIAQYLGSSADDVVLCVLPL